MADAPDETRKRLPNSETMVLAPSTRVFTRWTPNLIEHAKRMAEAGSLSQAVLLCDWLLTDDAVYAALQARVDALTALDVTFEPAQVKGSKAGGKDAKAPEAKPEAKPGDKPEGPSTAAITEPEQDPITAALEEDWDASYPEPEIAQILTWGRLLGVAPFRHETALNESGDRLLPNPRFWHPGTLAQDRQTEIWTVHDIAGMQHVVTPGDGAWGLFTPYGARRPWALGMWQCLADLVLIKQMARQDWSRASEKSALLVGEVPLDKDGDLPVGVDQKTDFVNKLSQRGGDAVAAMPPGWTLKLLQTADNYEIYLEQVRMINDAIASVIRGGNLTTNTTGGSLAAAQAQAATGDAPKLRADGKTLSTCLRAQSVVWWASWNFSDPALAPWPLWNAPTVAPEVNYFSFANGLKTLQDAGFELDFDALKNDYGLGFLKGYDPSNKVVPPPPSFGGGFGGKPKPEDAPDKKGGSFGG